MKVFEAPVYSNKELTKFFEGQKLKEGVINKKSLETLEEVRIVHRPFRKITWSLEAPTGSADKKSVSFIDERLCSQIDDSDHRFLLWRPRYATLKITETEESEIEQPETEDLDSVKKVVDDLMLHRWNGQELDDELRPKLRSLQADPLTSIALIVPRSPYGLKREETILVERKEVHSFVLASSLVTNSDSKDIMVSADIGEWVFVETAMANYRHMKDDSSRLLFLETPGSGSLRDALKSGRALARICDLYPDCIGLIG